MDGFKKSTKMQCFKEGGAVKYESRKEHKEEMSADIAQDKKIIKKAFKMHDAQEHKGEKTDLSKLKNGGRAKKAAGSVRKFENASGQYGAKKTDQDIKNIAQAKKFKCGGKVKKYSGEDGSYVSKGIDAVKSAGKKLYENVMGTPEQNRIAQESMNEQARKGSEMAKFFGGKADAESAPVKKCGGGRMKAGGKACS